MVKTWWKLMITKYLCFMNEWNVGIIIYCKLLIHDISRQLFCPIWLKVNQLFISDSNSIYHIIIGCPINYQVLKAGSQFAITELSAWHVGLRTTFGKSFTSFVSLPWQNPSVFAQRKPTNSVFDLGKLRKCTYIKAWKRILSTTSTK